MTAYPSKPPQQSRDRTALWAMLAFGMLSLACLAVVALAMSGGRLPDIGQEPSWTPPAAQAGLPVPAPEAPSSGLAAGMAVLNASAGPVNLRRSPGFQNKPSDDVLVAVPAGSVGAIVDGPQQADGLSWWRVRFGEREGWMAERSSSGVTLLARAP